MLNCLAYAIRTAESASSTRITASCVVSMGAASNGRSVGKASARCRKQAGKYLRVARDSALCSVFYRYLYTTFCCRCLSSLLCSHMHWALCTKPIAGLISLYISQVSLLCHHRQTRNQRCSPSLMLTSLSTVPTYKQFPQTLVQ